MKSSRTSGGLTALVKAAAGAAIVITTYPLQGYFIGRDIADEQMYYNHPGTIGYNPNKPTPNTKDFPNGRPERLRRTMQFYGWLKESFR